MTGGDFVRLVDAALDELQDYRRSKHSAWIL